MGNEIIGFLIAIIMVSVLLINILLYFGLAIVIKKRTKSPVQKGLATFFLVMAILGYITVAFGIYENVFILKSDSKISIVPYLLCFFCFIMLIYPFGRVYYSNMAFDEMPYNRTINIVINIWLFLLALFVVMKFGQVISSSTMGYDELYQMSAIEGDVANIYYKDNFFLLKFNNFVTNLMYSFSPFVMCYSFYGLIQKKITREKAFLLIGLMTLANILSALAIGSRGNLFFSMTYLLFFILIFFKRFDGKTKATIVKFGIIVLSAVLLYATAISVVRFANSDSETPAASVLRYFGEAFPSLGNLYWGEVTHHPYGTRMFPYIFGIEYEAESVHDGYHFWESFTGVPIPNYKTIFGDFYVEFGAIPAVFVIFIIAFSFTMFIGRKEINLWKISIIYWYFDLVLQGIFGFGKAGRSQFIVFIAILMVSLVIYFYIKWNIHHKYMANSLNQSKLKKEIIIRNKDVSIKC